jgi:hypothetical protein
MREELQELQELQQQTNMEALLPQRGKDAILEAGPVSTCFAPRPRMVAEFSRNDARAAQQRGGK